MSSRHKDAHTIPVEQCFRYRSPTAGDGEKKALSHCKPASVVFRNLDIAQKNQILFLPSHLHPSCTLRQNVLLSLTSS